MVTNVQPHAATIQRGDTSEIVSAGNIVWTAGVRATPIAERLAAATGATTDRQGRLMVGPDLSLAGHPEIFVIGDMAHFAPEGGPPLPGLAPVAMQQGRYVAKVVTARANGSATPPPFHYHDRGNMAVIGRRG